MKNIQTELRQQQGTKQNKELYDQQGKGQELNNLMINSEDTKDLSALLSHNPSPIIKDLLQKKVMDKYGLGLKQDTDFVVNNEIVAKFLDM